MQFLLPILGIDVLYGSILLRWKNQNRCLESELSKRYEFLVRNRSLQHLGIVH